MTRFQRVVTGVCTVPKYDTSTRDGAQYLLWIRALFRKEIKGINERSATIRIDSDRKED